MIYIASPYTHKDERVMEERYYHTCAFVAHMFDSGINVYSPIVHGHVLATMHALPRDSGFWNKFNFEMLEKAEGVFVLMLDGWKKSIGVREEINHALKVGGPITYVTWGIDVDAVKATEG